jgi:alkylation response protein AidB-like acyl-CoA dehydrogenase
LKTRAVRDGDEYVVNGAKVFTSGADLADYVWLAVRTDPEAPKHKGLSMLLVPTSAEGFSWTPVRTMAGVTTSATFYQDVRVPLNALVGDENKGWSLITNQLNHERVALCSAANLQHAVNDVRRWAHETTLADGRRVIDQEWVQIHLARVHAKTEFLKLINWKIAWGVKKGVGMQDASATKVFGTELATEAWRLLMEVLGEEAVVRSGSPGSLLRSRLERMYRSALILTFGGGTNEVQRDIIAMVGLGMPRAPRF